MASHRFGTLDGEIWECLNRGCRVHLRSDKGVPVLFDGDQPVLKGSRNSAREWSKAIKECKAIRQELQS